MDLSRFFEILDEQVIVKFTGRINLLDQITNQLFGYLLIFEGDFIFITYKNHLGMKAFYYLSFDLEDKHKIKVVTEPELLNDFQRNIHYPYQNLKAKLLEALEKFRISKKGRPPEQLKLLIISDFINQGAETTAAEFDTMCIISDFNLVRDIYKNSSLLDFEVTNALVSLRQKGAIKVIKS